MLNSDLYVQGDQNVQMPAHLNFGKFMMNRLLQVEENKMALINAETGETLTYKDLTQYAVDLAVSLRKMGIDKGDIVGFGCEKRIMFIPTALAIVFTGATYTPFDVNCGRAVLKHQLSITKPRYFICSELFWNTNNEVLRSFDCIKSYITIDSLPKSAITTKSLLDKHYDVKSFEPVEVNGQTDVAFILYSSGTTGMPKGVELTHVNCILHSSPPNYFKDSTLKRAFVVGAWSHNYCTFKTFKFFCLGKTVVFLNTVNAESLLQCIEEYQVNIALTIPVKIFWLSKVEDSKYKLESLKILYSRSAPLHVKTMEQVKQKFASIKYILQGYGMTEAGEPTSECWGTKGPKPGSVGKASPGITIKVVDPVTREVLGPNKHGEICLKGPTLMKGYVGVDPSTYLDDEGFFKTGDLGYYDDDRYFYIVDRLKEIICYCGFKIAPLELETLLLLHPAVRDAAVIGKPDPDFIELPTAFIVKQPGTDVTEKELMDYIAPEVAAYMQLRGGVKFLTEIPRNQRGKILRRHLREMLNE